MMVVMAGGMFSREGMSLAERSRRSGIGHPGPVSAQAAAPDPGLPDVEIAGPERVDRQAGDGSDSAVAVEMSSVSAGAPSATNVKHCWVVDSPLSPGRWPGLLLSWRRSGAGWQGLAAWVVDDDDGPVVLQAWVRAVHLQAL